MIVHLKVFKICHFCPWHKVCLYFEPGPCSHFFLYSFIIEKLKHKELVILVSMSKRSKPKFLILWLQHLTKYVSVVELVFIHRNWLLPLCANLPHVIFVSRKHVIHRYYCHSWRALGCYGNNEKIPPIPAKCVSTLQKVIMSTFSDLPSSWNVIQSLMKVKNRNMKHSVSGGQCDNVALFSGSSRKC